MFADRIEAGQQLADALEQWRGKQPLVLGLPRGGVVVAAEVAHRLEGELDVILVKKLRAPENPELAMGAVTENGEVTLNEPVVRMLRVDEEYIEAERRVRLAEMAAQRESYRAVRPQVELTGRVVILVDDGLATGATMIAAVQGVSLRQPEKLIVAVPVGPPETLDTIRHLEGVDEVVCLHAPTWFQGVGQFYRNFAQTSDEEVIELLAHEAAHK